MTDEQKRPYWVKTEWCCQVEEDTRRWLQEKFDLRPSESELCFTVMMAKATEFMKQNEESDDS